MRSDNDGRRAPIIRCLICGLAIALAGCAGDGEGPAAIAHASPRNGPQADYPVVIGAPYEVAGERFVPEDRMNYDQVGRSTEDGSAGPGVSAAHHTLPLPSYVEVTSLDTGRTALVRVERRGPMTDTALIALSRDALAQLEMAPGKPVRVRRVNPPEEQRALLRIGRAAPLRMDTPMPLVTALKRELAGPEEQVAALAEPAGKSQEAVIGEALAPLSPDSRTARSPHQNAHEEPASRTPVPPAKPDPSAQQGRFVVQAGAFSTPARAQRVADTLGATVTRSGKFYRVRTGPFASREQAEAALAKVRDAGYSEARIFTIG